MGLKNGLFKLALQKIAPMVARIVMNKFAPKLLRRSGYAAPKYGKYARYGYGHGSKSRGVLSMLRRLWKKFT